MSASSSLKGSTSCANRRKLPSEKSFRGSPVNDNHSLTITLPSCGNGKSNSAMSTTNENHGEPCPKTGTDDTIDLTVSPEIHPVERDIAAPLLEQESTKNYRELDESSIGFSRNLSNSSSSVASSFPYLNLRTNTGSLSEFVQDAKILTVQRLANFNRSEANPYLHQLKSPVGFRNSVSMMAQPRDQDFTIESLESMTLFDDNEAELRELHRKLKEKLMKVALARHKLANNEYVSGLRADYAEYCAAQLREIDQYFLRVSAKINERHAEIRRELTKEPSELDESVETTMAELDEMQQELERCIEDADALSRERNLSQSTRQEVVERMKCILNGHDTVVYRNSDLPQIKTFKDDWWEVFIRGTMLPKSCSGSVLCVTDGENPPAPMKTRNVLPICQSNSERASVQTVRNYKGFLPIAAANNANKVMPYVPRRAAMSASTSPSSRSRRLRNFVVPQSEGAVVAAETKRIAFLRQVKKWKDVKNGCETNGIVTHVISPREFYVVMDDFPDAWKSLQEELKEHRVDDWRTAEKLTKGDVYVTFEYSTADWRRVECLSYDHAGNVHVQCVDTGMTTIKYWNELRVPPWDMNELLPHMAQLCALSNCWPTVAGSQDWSEEAIENFQALTLDKVFTVKIENAFKKKCEVSLTRDGRSITDTFADLGFCKTTYRQWKAQPLKKIDYFYEEYGVLEWVNVDVIHVDHPARFYVQKDPTKTIENTFEKLNVELTEYFKDRTNLDSAMIAEPQVGYAVAAKRNKSGKWHRAEITQIIDESTCVVRYVDRGDCENVKITKMAALPEKFARITVAVTKCILKDVRPLRQHWSKEANAFFSGLVRGKTLRMVVREKNAADHSLVVDLYNESNKENMLVSRTLIEMGHARGVGDLVSVKPVRKKVATADEKAEKRDEAIASKASSAQKPASAALSESKKEAPAVEKVKEKTSTEYSSEIDEVEKLNESGDEVTTNLPAAVEDDTYMVVVVSCDRPSELRFKFKNESAAYKRLLEAMTAYYSNEKNYEESAVERVEPSMKCAVLYEHDDAGKKWHRGVVSKVEDDEQVEVTLCDVGDAVVVSARDVRQMRDEFTKMTDNVMRVSLAGFETADKDEWPADVESVVKDEMQKYEEYCVAFQGNGTVDLWGKMDICHGALDPAFVKWTHINRKLLQVERSKAGDAAHPIMEEDLLKLDKENGLVNPNDNVAEWLDSQVNSQESAIEVDGNEYDCSSMSRDSKSASKRLLDRSHDDAASVDSESSSEINEEITDWLPSTPLQETQFTGVPTYVDNECNIYVQPTEAQATLVMISNGLDSKFANSYPSPNDLHWKPGEICTAWYHLDRLWYRGRVLKVGLEDGKVLVEYVDYGNIELVNPSDLRKKTVLVEIPIQCHRIPIRSDCVPTSDDGKWPIPALEFVHKTIIDKQCQIFVRREENEDFYRIERLMLSQFELFDVLYQLNHAVCTSSTRENKSNRHRKTRRPTAGINSHRDQKPSALADKKTRRPCKDEEDAAAASSSSSSDSSISAFERMSTDSSFSINFAKLRQLSNSNELIVSEAHVPESAETMQVEVSEVINAKQVVINLISCDTDASVLECRNLFVKMCEELQAEAETQPLMSPPLIGRLCCAKFHDGMWYRAYIAGQCADDKSKVSVYYIDYGNLSPVDLSELRELKPSWYHVPAQGVKCTLDNVKLPSKKEEIHKIEDKLSKKLLNKELTATIRRNSSKNKYYVTLKNSDGVEPYRKLFRTR